MPGPDPASTSEEGAPQFAGDATAAETERSRIEQRAYEIYVARGGEAGRELDDWLSAERELNGEDRSASEEEDR